MAEVEWRGLDEVAAGLLAVEAEWRVRNDRRAVFASVYRMMSEAMRHRLEQRLFEDNAWVERYTITFANLYRAAISDYATGAIDRVPKAWRLSFDESRAGGLLVVQDLLLGMNAHINYDLALALFAVGIKTDRAKRRRDHDAVNRVLGVIVDDVQTKVAEMYARGLGVVDGWAGRLDETVTGFGLQAARDNAWTFGVALSGVRFEVERQVIRKVLDRSAAVMARGLLGIGLRPEIVVKLRALEQGAVPVWVS